jgi:hypothetical protein
VAIGSITALRLYQGGAGAQKGRGSADPAESLHLITRFLIEKFSPTPGPLAKSSQFIIPASSFSQISGKTKAKIKGYADLPLSFLRECLTMPFIPRKMIIEA